MPSISMNPAVRYKTQSSAYDQLLVGKRLTDRRITALKKAGYYGPTGILFQSKQQTKEKAKPRRRTTLLDILSQFDV